MHAGRKMRGDCTALASKGIPGPSLALDGERVSLHRICPAIFFLRAVEFEDGLRPSDEVASVHMGRGTRGERTSGCVVVQLLCRARATGATYSVGAYDSGVAFQGTMLSSVGKRSG